MRKGLGRAAVTTLPLLLATLFWTVIALSIRHQSQTFDEGFHLVAGYRYWQCRDFGVNSEHPPLVKIVAATPLWFSHIPAPRGACGKDQTTKDYGYGLGYNYLYGEKELAGWKERIENVAAKAQTTYVITNNHFESKAGVNALELKAMVTGKRVVAPPTLVQKYPELRRFADPAEDSGETPGSQLPLLA